MVHQRGHSLQHGYPTETCLGFRIFENMLFRPKPNRTDRRPARQRGDVPAALAELV
jgi:hypothetical protein